MLIFAEINRLEAERSGFVADFSTSGFCEHCHCASDFYDRRVAYVYVHVTTLDRPLIEL